MTLPDFERFLERWDLAAPVTMDDLAHIQRELKKIVAAGVPTELVLRGDRVEVALGHGAGKVSRWLAIRAAA